MSVILPILAAIGATIAQAMIWFHAPVEQSMGLVQKIFYFHLPLAWWSMISFFVVFSASAWFLYRGDARADRLARAAAELGVLLATLALLTGAIWARPIWNTYWTWDPRLTTTLIMWFIYMAYLLLCSINLGGNAARIRAVVGIAAFLDVPLVFFAARKWRSIHPTVFANPSGGLEPEMLTTVIVCLAAFGLLWLAMLRARLNQLTTGARIAALAARGD